MEIAAEDAPVWPEAIQQEIRSLEPSPAAFLSALVGFWADVALQQYRERMHQPDALAAAALSQTWASPHIALFPVTPAEPPGSANMMRGLWVWNFIEKIGPCGALIESQLLACLDHPEPVVWSAAESAFATVDQLSDAGFAQFLAVAERHGSNGQLWKRAQIAALHVNPTRMTLLLNGLEPGADETLALARFAILERLEGEVAATAYHYLLRYLPGEWSDAQRANLIRALTSLSQTLGFDPRAISQIKTWMQSPTIELQCAALGFLVAHSPLADRETLLNLPADAHPWVLTELCRGLARHTQLPPELLRMLIARSLGNFDGYDGEPHDSAVTLLTDNAGYHASAALPEIVTWWEATSAKRYLDREIVADALKIAEVLGVAAAPLKPGMERALASLMVESTEDEWPALDQPGAIPEIQERLQVAMTEAGTPPEIASTAGEWYAGFFTEFSKNADILQKEIDEQQAQFDAEQKELYPELLVTEESDLDRDEEEQTSQEEEEDELLVRLRAWLEIMNSR